MDFKFDMAVTREEGLSLLLEHWLITLKQKTEFIPLQKALGRVTAKPHFSFNTLPVCRSSMVDGIAVKSANFLDGIPDTSPWVKGVDYVAADTGDDFPDGFDTVIAMESIYYDESGNLHLIDDFLFTPGDLIRAKGSMIRQGELLVKANVCLTPVHMAALAMGGHYQIEVFRKPRVVYIPTGSELTALGVKPERGQNVESNGIMVESLLKQWGAEAICYPIIRDKPVELEKTLENAIAAGDIVLINGGSSKGEEDFNASLLQSKASFFRHGIKAVPGRPVAISIIDGKPVINLPGPVIATLIAMDWCVQGLVYNYYGLTIPKRPTIKAKLTHPLSKKKGYERYVMMTLQKADGEYLATSLDWECTIPETLLMSQILFIAPFDKDEYESGEEIEVEILCRLEEVSKL